MLRESLYFEDLAFRLKSLMLYKNVAKDKALTILCDMAVILSAKDNRDMLKNDPVLRELYYEFIRTLIESAETKGFSGNIFKKHVINLFLRDENIFSIACEAKKQLRNLTIFEMAMNDINTLYFLMTLDVKNLADNIGLKENIINYMPMKIDNSPFSEQIASFDSHEKIMDSLIWYYQMAGPGDIGQCAFLCYDDDKGIVGVSNPDKITFDDIIGYEKQKKIIIENTEAFLNGVPANNMLLTGSRGTGKSSCVKALANKYFAKGLRLVEIRSGQIKRLPDMLRDISGRNKKFILFMDDLSFEDFEVEYKYMKSVLEGGAFVRPDNVLFYATSNRRHIVQETWSDKNGADSGDLHTTDSSNEKLSLSDRFGITVTFQKPTQEEFLNIVAGIAKSKNFAISEEFLKEMALKWELNQKGFSGRTAKQFINNIIWELKKG